MGWQRGRDDGAGGAPDPDPGLPRAHGVPLERAVPGSRPAANPGEAAEGTPARDPHLAGFARDGQWDACPPSSALAAALEAASGTEWRCPGASRDELLGLLGQAQALESWAAAAKCGILRSLIRDDEPLPGGGYHGGKPESWTKSLTHEVALTLSMPTVSADKLMWTAWDLQARLPGTGGLLATGDLTYAKARAVSEALLLLSDEDTAKAETMILPKLPGKTYGQVQKLAVQAAITVDPESAARRREHAERENSRVSLSREDSGATALSGRDLPTDQALAAHAHVCARAQEYKNSGAFPDDTRMDQFRATGYLDLLNGIPAEARIAIGQIVTVTRTSDTPCSSERETGQPDADGPGTDAACPGTDESGDSDPDDSGPDDSDPDDSDPDDSDPDDSDPDDSDPDDSGPDDGGPGVPPSAPPPGLPAPKLADLVLPLATLLGLAQRPGESHGVGPLDPELCRQLASAAVGSLWTQLCVTVTDSNGIAIGHGCARLARHRTHGNQLRNRTGGIHGYPDTGLVLALPSRANLTITGSLLAELARRTGMPGAPPGESEDAASSWSFIPADDSGPPGGFGAWTLILPDGRNLTVNLEPVPTFTCDHGHESHAYQPNDTLRHLVQIRDYECTFPPCSKHATESDFEHAVPYHKGGRTCSCNAGARSRACHRVKQSPGWNVTQPRPGWHQWTTPTGRTYTQGPKHYPT
jgi:hypothetical protein